MTFKTDDKNTKVFAALLTHVSAKTPKEVNKYMSLLERLIDGESPTMRSAMLDVIENIISKYLIFEEGSIPKTQCEMYFDILELRMADTSGYVRAKSLQICNNLNQ
jgi:hypothetical protein